MTNDSMATRLYAEQVGGGYYYQTNYLEPGARHPAKLLSRTALSLSEVLANLTYRSAAEARRNSKRTSEIARRVVLLVDQASSAPILTTYVMRPVGAPSVRTEFADAERAEVR